MKKFITQAKEQNAFQYTLVYGGGVWATVQIVDFLSNKFDWDPSYVKLLTIILFGSVPAAFVFFFFRLKLNSNRKRLFFYAINTALVMLLANYISPLAGVTNPKKASNKTNVNIAAQNWVLKGKYRITDNNNDIDSAILFFQKAITVDSSYALAYALLSKVYAMKNFFIDPNGGYSEKAFVAASTALALNPDLAEANFAYSFCTWTYANKFPSERAIRGYKKAIALKPDYEDAYQYLALTYGHVGLYDEFLENIEKAIQLNPENHISTADKMVFIILNADSSRFQWCQDTYRLLPDKSVSAPLRQSQRILLELYLGNREAAEHLLSSSLKKFSLDINIKSIEAIMLAQKNQRKEVLEIIHFIESQDLSQGHSHHGIYNLGVAYSILGEKELAMEKLIWAVDNGFPNIAAFKNDPFLNSLRDYQPFKELMKRLDKDYEKYKKIADEDN